MLLEGLKDHSTVLTAYKKITFMWALYGLMVSRVCKVASDLFADFGCGAKQTASPFKSNRRGLCHLLASSLTPSPTIQVREQKLDLRQITDVEVLAQLVLQCPGFPRNEVQPNLAFFYFSEETTSVVTSTGDYANDIPLRLRKEISLCGVCRSDFVLPKLSKSTCLWC